MKRFLVSTLIATTLLTTNVFAYADVNVTPISQPIPTAKGLTTLKTFETASIKVTPDLAKVYFTIEVYGDTALDAKILIDDALSSVKNNLINANLIEEKDFIMDYMSIFPDFKYDAEKDEYLEVGYTANNSFIISVNDLNNLNTIIDTALDMDNIYVRSLSFDTTKRNEYYSQALLKAIENGKQKADTISKTVFDNKEVEILNISELSYNTYYYGEGDASLAKSPEGVAGGDYNFIPTSVDISANIEMTFGIK